MVRIFKYYSQVWVADKISIVIIKVRAVVTVWHVLAVNVRLSPVSHPYFYQAIMIYDILNFTRLTNGQYNAKLSGLR